MRYQNFLKREIQVMKEPSESTAYTILKNPSVIIGWNSDSGKVSQQVISSLIDQLSGTRSAAIEPEGFFFLDGVRVEENCIQFPESIFYSCQKKDLLFFLSDQPDNNHYRFLNTFFDVAEQQGTIHELYTINGMVSQKAHTAPRRIFAVFNSPELQDMLISYNIDGLTWEGTPSISSFLLWIAWKRNIPGLSLWIEVPFYLSAVTDFLAIKIILSFFNQRFNLNLALSDIDKKIEDQNDTLELSRNENPEIDKYLGLLESGLGLKEEVKIKLTQDIYAYLKR
jgi:proteasome assembly chaperone (PAC2) family protein